MRYSAYLLDIEGTTTPVDFVTKTLFPFARRSMQAFLSDSLNDPAQRLALVADCCLLSEDHEKETGAPVWPNRPDPGGVLDYLYWLMDRDRKTTGLKAIQGRIWEAGYRDGRIHGEVYPDVWHAVRRWKDRGAGVFIYSSGSVLAQRLLFQHLPEGDMTQLIDGYFDTTTGPKREPASYSAIAEQIGHPVHEVAFLSDNVDEIDAAKQAGMWAFLVERDGTTVSGHAAVQSFDEIE